MFKNKILVIVLVTALLAALYMLYKKTVGLLNLGYDVGTPKPVGTWLESLKTLSVKIPITLKNFSAESYTIKSLKADLYTRSGIAIAEQTEALKQPIYIMPQTDTQIELLFSINWSGITAWFLSENVTLDKVPGMLKNYLKTEVLGIPAVLTGAVAAEGLYLPINTSIDF